MKKNPALDIQHLSKTYANGTVALKEMSFTVEEGDFFALLGPNGAGKSTTIGIITSLINKTSGTVNILGYDLHTQPAQAKSLIGLVPQEFNFNIFDTVINALVTQAGYYGIAKKQALRNIEKYLTILDLWQKKDQKIRFLSGGMKRRLLIARALIHEPRLLILDEPTAGVDIELRRLLWGFLTKINQAGTTVILTTHYLEEAEQLCRNVGIIHQGCLIEHAPMKDLLEKLNIETFIFYLSSPVMTCPEMRLPCRLIDNKALEIDLQEGFSLSQVFADLATLNIPIKTMRNKVNRLEELFLTLTRK